MRADAGVVGWFSGVGQHELYISVLVVGEIRQGVERLKGRDPDQASVFEAWLAELRRSYGERIVAISAEDAEEWGRMSAPDPLPAVDSLMAAQAKTRGMTLVTGNTRDFERTGIELLDPFESR